MPLGKFSNFLKFLRLSQLQMDILSSLEQSDSIYKGQLLEFYQYFEKNYVGSMAVEKKSQGGKPKNPKPVDRLDQIFSRPSKFSAQSIGMFILEYWIKFLGQTLLNTEARYNIFSSILSKHPHVYSLVDCLRKEQKLVEDIIISLNADIVYKREPKCVELDEKLIFAIKSYKYQFQTY